MGEVVDKQELKAVEAKITQKIDDLHRLVTDAHNKADGAHKKADHAHTRIALADRRVEHAGIGGYMSACNDASLKHNLKSRYDFIDSKITELRKELEKYK